MVMCTPKAFLGLLLAAGAIGSDPERLLATPTLENPKTCPAETTVAGKQWATRYHANDCIMPVIQNPARAGATDINLVVMGPYTGAIGDVMTKAEPLLAAALQEIENSTILPGYRLNAYMVNTACQAQDGIAATIRIFQTPPTKHGILGDSCSGVCASVNDAMQIYNVLQIAPVCTSTSLSNQDRYPYLIRFSPSARWFVEATVEIFKLLSWRRIGVVVENRAINFGQRDVFVKRIEAEKNAGTYPWVFLAERKYISPADSPGILAHMRKYDARIIFMTMYEDEGAVLICEAYNQGMLAPDYVWAAASGWWNDNFLAIREAYVKTSVEAYGGTACSLNQMMRAGFGLLAFDRGDMQESDVLHSRSGRRLRDIRAQYVKECGAFAGGAGMCQMFYSGYQYDALWQWAWLLDQYLVQSSHSISDLGTKASRQWLYDKELRADFMGVTGRVRHFNDVDPKTDPPSHGDRDGTILCRQLRREGGAEGWFEKLAFWSQGGGFQWQSNFMWSYADASKKITCSANACDIASGFVPSDRIGACPAGTVFNEEKGCEPCIPGFSAGVGATACTICTQGKFTGGSGQSACDGCPTGKFGKEPGATECENCTRGTYTATAGQQKCERCSIGSFAENEGSKKCADCPGDFTTKYPGTISATECGCAKDSYHDSRSAGSRCQSCPAGFMCSGGKAVANGAATDQHIQPILEKGFYSTAADPYKAFSCSEAKSLCLGGKADSCGGKRHGLQCAFCDIGKIAPHDESCTDCGGGPFVAYPAAVIVGFLVLCGVHKVTSGKKAGAFTQLPMFSVGSLIVSQAQLVALMVNYDVEWPDAFSGLLRILGVFLFDMNVVSTSCYFGFSLAAKYIPGVMMPVGVVVGMVILYFGSKIIKGAFGKTDALDLNSVINTLGLILTALSVAVFKAIVNIFECRPNPSADDTMKNYDGFDCYGDDMMALLPVTILAILIFIVGGGSVYAFVVVKGPQMFHSSADFRQRFRFIIKRWHPTYYWWGSLVLSRNLAMCLVTVVSTDGLMQLALLGCVFAPVYFATLRVQPWRDIAANWSDNCLSSSLLVIMFFGAMLVDSPTSGTRSALGVGIVLAIVAALVTVCLITLDMLLIIARGKGIFLSSPVITDGFVNQFVETVAKCSLLSEQGHAAFLDDIHKFLAQLPQSDAKKLLWLVNIMQSGLFAEKAKGISGISPVAPRAGDERVNSVKRISSARMETGEAVLPKVDDVWV